MKKHISLAAAAAVLWISLSGPVGAREEAGPVEVKAVPQWTRINTVAEVEFAPNLPIDVFRHQGAYYCYDGRWHRSTAWGGPWTVIPQPPPVFYRIDAAYFKKIPPGWSRGRKTGWQGGALPPGQAKKLGQPRPVPVEGPAVVAPMERPIPAGKGKHKDKGLPPGQMKKMGY